MKKSEDENGENCIMRSSHNVYPASDIIRVMKSRKTRWLGHVAPVGVMKIGTEVRLET
jgi:hypothetical protein